MRQPGFEPGSIAWKATILTTRLLAHNYKLPAQSGLKPFPRSTKTKQKAAKKTTIETVDQCGAILLQKTQSVCLKKSMFAIQRRRIPKGQSLFLKTLKDLLIAAYTNRLSDRAHLVFAPLLAGDLSCIKSQKLKSDFQHKLFRHAYTQSRQLSVRFQSFKLRSSCFSFQSATIVTPCMFVE